MVALGPKAEGAGLGPTGGAQPVAVLRAAWHRTAYALPAKTATTACAGASPTGTSDPASTPGCRLTYWRTRRVDAGPRQHVDRCARIDSGRVGRVRRPVLGVLARDHPPPAAPLRPGYGARAGLLGLCAVTILRALYPDVAVAVVARFDAQAELAPSLRGRKGFRRMSRGWPSSKSWSPGAAVGCISRCKGCRWPTPERIDVVYDTVGKPETFEVGVRGSGFPGDAGQGWCPRARPVGVEPAVLQRDQLGRLECLRNRGNRRTAQARHRPLPGPGGGRPGGPAAHADPHLPAGPVARRLPRDRQPGRQWRHQGSDRPTLGCRAHSTPYAHNRNSGRTCGAIEVKDRMKRCLCVAISVHFEPRRFRRSRGIVAPRPRCRRVGAVQDEPRRQAVIDGHVAPHIDQMQSAARAQDTENLSRGSGFRLAVQMVQHH